MSYFNTQDPICSHDNCPSHVQLTLLPRMVDLGGFEVGRVLPSQEQKMVGPFVFWDQAGPGEFITGQGLDVRPHPHIGLETLTYLFQGRMHHRDSLDHSQIIQPGDVNLMTAGAGIVHSERTPTKDREHTNELFGLQCWLGLPKAKETSTPNFKHYSKEGLPAFEDTGLQGRVAAGHFQGLNSPVKTLGDALFVDFNLGPGAKLSIPADFEERAIHIVEGTVELQGESYAATQMLILQPGATVTLTATTAAKIILLGGEPLDGSRHLWWNFVSSSRELIEQAKEDWLEGRFDKVPGDEVEFTPLPRT